MTYYEPPVNISQWIVAIKETMKLENYVKGWSSRMQYAFAVGSFDIAAKVALYRQFNSGWQNNFGGVDYGFHRKIPTTAVAAALASPLAVAVEMAKNAYYADKTFPKHLQKGYTGYFNALARIPFEEGPYYLFKNSWPLFAKHFMSVFTPFLTFDWTIDKFSIMWRISEVPRYALAAVAAAFSVTLGAIMIYPMSNATK
jgi:solute carrier family 25 oxoglutarate transporter 11